MAKNQIEIDVADLLLDVEIGRTIQQVTPRALSGLEVDFAVRRTRHALASRWPRVHPGRRGEVWLTDLANSRQRLLVSWSTGGRPLDVALPTSPNGVPASIGPVVCEHGER